MSDQPLLVERVDEGIAALTLSLPERRNAMTAPLTAAWGEAIASLAADRDLRAVVVLAEGPAFCAGGDLSWIGGDGSPVSPDELRAKMLPFYRTWLSVRDLPVPTIAGVNGAAIGAGLCLALACDLRYAGPRAAFAAPFTGLGMHPGMAATYLLREAVGTVRARELLFTGRVVRAEEAVRIGLAHGAVETDDPAALREHVLAVARTVAATAPVATRLTKVALNSPPRSLAEALEWEALAQPVTMATDDLREGLAAVAEKRAPVFRGR